jgi:hypothetical protein
MVWRSRPIEAWPRLMTAATAAAYCDEMSVEAFRRGVGEDLATREEDRR